MGYGGCLVKFLEQKGTYVVSVAAYSGTSGTSLVPFYFKSSDFFVLYDFAFLYDN